MIFYAICTADSTELQEGKLAMLLDSLRPTGVRAVVVLRAVDQTQSEWLSRHPAVWAVVHIGTAGISRARNAGIRAIETDSDFVESVISFPDDDCEYPPGLPQQVLAFMTDEHLDFLVGWYGDRSDPTPQYPSAAPIDIAACVHRVSSVGLFARARAVLSVGPFNESLGVGTAIAAGEETDWALRAVRAGLTGWYTPDIHVYHPRSTAFRLERYRAWVALAVAYALREPYFRRRLPLVWAGIAKRVMLGQVTLRQAVACVGWAHDPRTIRAILSRKEHIPSRSEGSR